MSFEQFRLFHASVGNFGLGTDTGFVGGRMCLFCRRSIGSIPVGENAEANRFV
jgi:hypothetical protein